MKISNERREELKAQCLEDLTKPEYLSFRQLVDAIIDWSLNILDQELSNHTQRIIDEIWARPTYPDQDGCFTRDCILELPSLQLNPTKDNDTTQ